MTSRISLKLVPILLLMVVLYLSGCKSRSLPRGSLSDVSFKIEPHIVYKNEEYFLRYQIHVDNKNTLKRVLYCQKNKGEAAYFFSIPVSHFERGGLVERPLSMDSITEYAENDAVYWLNENDSKIKLKIQY